MAPPPIVRTQHASRLLLTLFSAVSQHVPKLARIVRGDGDDLTRFHTLAKRVEAAKGSPAFIAFAVLIPVLVLLSGVFAGLTLGYMSLDETQLNVLIMSGTPEQKKYAKKIMPIRKDGHLLLITLILANMIVNETLPVISDPVLGGGAQSVVVSTVLIVIFSEIIPQSLCTRHGLYIGAKMAGFTKVLIYFLGIVAWPVAKLLEFILGSHHGIIYRRAELKELIAMHSAVSSHGGDLKSDTVTIIGATLDLQDKVVSQAMTPIDDVFMLSIDARLDYELLKKICSTGHSRVPVYEEKEIAMDYSGRKEKVKKILGILLVKHCVLLDPQDATPLRDLPLNRILFVPNNESLLGILDRFQEGRTHMAVVSRYSAEKAASVKKVAKRTLTQRFRERVGLEESSDEEEGAEYTEEADNKTSKEREVTFVEPGVKEHDYARGPRGSNFRRGTQRGVEMGVMKATKTPAEQSMPADALLTKKDADQFLQTIDAALSPLGIITLEDVLEELIGEEIYDEFDSEGAGSVSSFVPNPEEPNVAKETPKEALFVAEPIEIPSSPNAASPDTPSSPNAGDDTTSASKARAKKRTLSGDASRSVPPSPILEAVLYSRKRGHAGRPQSSSPLTSSDGAPVPCLPPTRPVHLKGSKFKSSPLNTSALSVQPPEGPSATTKKEPQEEGMPEKEEADAPGLKEDGTGDS
ncbi:DUF21-domain-containing protein [Coniophora puteana RWD-64-598 SS2]|uniref:DUF21-domain-containing protein n=1 Tax=Coniophora puteana (strain RWD-64-598) TaxID=741705 RepID=A0A5M3M9X9_CONPW|nr:DUF21-domain-containing protein [Coniophora puteana RWD-64-598 SS2]EIW75999.1 DUF21-domain-containing protein [Coniophora puteana RWD-64-598 SS2]